MVNQRNPAMAGDMEQGAVALGRSVRIMPMLGLPDLDMPAAQAFAAVNVAEQTQQIMALLCRPTHPARTDLAAAIRQKLPSHMLRMVDFGVVDWPDQNRRFAIAYERPTGPRVFANLSSTRQAMAEEDVIRRVLRPAYEMLIGLADAGIYNGAIRPTNIYEGAGQTAPVTFGDCLTGVASSGQPAMFETIERSMAQPSGRGAGAPAHDLYALGITLIFCLLGRHPLPGYSDEQILSMKIERGTYPALLSQHRVPLHLIEPLRGMLSDDPRSRWDLRDLDLWLNGRRLTPRQPEGARRAPRPIKVRTNEHWHPRTLAMAMAQDPSAALAMINSGEVERWLRRSAGFPIRADNLQTALRSLADHRGGASEDRVLGRVLTAIDPPGPMRARGRAVMPMGLAGAMADAAMAAQDLSPYAEMVAGQLPGFWYNQQEEFRPEFLGQIKQFEIWRNYLLRPMVGFGIERLLYEMNPTLPLLSPAFRKYHVIDIRDFLTTLETVSTAGDRPEEPFDRHVIAWLCVRLKRVDDWLLTALGEPPDSGRRALATAHLLTMLQGRYPDLRLPGVTAWLAQLLEPNVEAYRNREQRDRIRTQIAQAVEHGRLGELVASIDDQRQIEADTAGFVWAAQRFARLQFEREVIGRELLDPARLARGAGRQFAAAVSGGIACLWLLALLLYTLIEGGLS